MSEATWAASRRRAAPTIARGAGPRWSLRDALRGPELRRANNRSQGRAMQRLRTALLVSDLTAPMTAAGRTPPPRRRASLLRSDNSTGFKHVAKQGDTLRKPYVAQPPTAAVKSKQGMFATAEAALAVARFLARSQGRRAEAASRRRPRRAVASRAADVGGGVPRGGGGGGCGWCPPTTPPGSGRAPQRRQLPGSAVARRLPLHLGQLRGGGGGARRRAHARPDGLALEAEALAAPMTAAEALAAAGRGLTLKRAKRRATSTSGCRGARRTRTTPP